METNMLREAAVVMAVLLVSYLLMLGLSVALFRIFFPIQKDPGRSVESNIRQTARKSGRSRKMKLVNG